MNNIKKLDKDIYLISIIIPCYNVENTIKRTLNSLELQTFSDFQVIIINDGSVDNTDLVIRNYIKNTKLNISYISQENSGVSNARNRGLKEAKGKYIMFLDADDVYNKDFIKIMYETLIKYKVDTVYCLYSRNIKKVMNETVTVFDKDVTLLNQTQLMDDYMYKTKKFNFWSFIYKSDIIRKNNIWFTPGLRYGEDREFLWKYIVSCKGGAVVNKELYGYYNNPQSAINTVNWYKIDSLDATSRIEKYLKEIDCKYYETFKNYMYARTMWSVAKTFAQGNRIDLYDRLHEEYDVKTCMRKMASVDPSILVRVSSAIYCIHPKLFFFLIRYTWRFKFIIDR